MARPRKAESQRRDHKIELRVTKDEYENFKAQADERGLTISDWLRVLLSRMPKDRLAKLQIVDIRTPAAIMSLSGNLRALYNEYGRTGNFYPDKTAAILDTIRETIFSIKRAHDHYYQRELGKDDRQSN